VHTNDCRPSQLVLLGGSRAKRVRPHRPACFVFPGAARLLAFKLCGVFDIRLCYGNVTYRRRRQHDLQSIILLRLPNRAGSLWRAFSFGAILAIGHITDAGLAAGPYGSFFVARCCVIDLGSDPRRQPGLDCWREVSPRRDLGQ